MADREKVLQQVIEVTSEVSGLKPGDSLGEDTSLDDLNLDSLDTVELVMELEDKFRIEIPDDEAEEITGEQTIGHLTDLVVKKLGDR